MPVLLMILVQLASTLEHVLMQHLLNIHMVSVRIGSHHALTMEQQLVKQKLVHLLLEDFLPMIQLHVKCISQLVQALWLKQVVLIRHVTIMVIRLQHLVMLIVVLGYLIVLLIHQTLVVLIIKHVLMLL